MMLAAIRGAVVNDGFSIWMHGVNLWVLGLGLPCCLLGAEKKIVPSVSVEALGLQIPFFLLIPNLTVAQTTGE